MVSLLSALLPAAPAAGPAPKASGTSDAALAAEFGALLAIAPIDDAADSSGNHPAGVRQPLAALGTDLPIAAAAPTLADAVAIAAPPVSTRALLMAQLAPARPVVPTPADIVANPLVSPPIVEGNTMIAPALRAEPAPEATVAKHAPASPPVLSPKASATPAPARAKRQADMSLDPAPDDELPKADQPRIENGGSPSSILADPPSPMPTTVVEELRHQAAPPPSHREMIVGAAPVDTPLSRPSTASSPHARPITSPALVLPAPGTGTRVTQGAPRSPSAATDLVARKGGDGPPAMPATSANATVRSPARSDAPRSAGRAAIDPPTASLPLAPATVPAVPTRDAALSPLAGEARRLTPEEADPLVAPGDAARAPASLPDTNPVAPTPLPSRPLPSDAMPIGLAPVDPGLARPVAQPSPVVPAFFHSVAAEVTTRGDAAVAMAAPIASPRPSDSAAISPAALSLVPVPAPAASAATPILAETANAIRTNAAVAATPDAPRSDPPRPAPAVIKSPDVSASPVEPLAREARPARAEPAFRAFAAALFDAAGSAPAVDTAPATPLPDAEPLDLTQPRWPHAMVDRIERLRDEASLGDTRIRLVPDALGTIDVALRRDGDTVHVAFRAEQAETRQLLAEARPELAALAEARGIRLAEAAPASAGGWTGTAANSGQTFAGQERAPSRQHQPSTPAASPRIAHAAEDEGDDTRIA